MTGILITKQMKINEVIEKYPETVEVFERFEIHCAGCMGASLESIADGAMVHGIDPEELVEELNKAIHD